MKLTWPRIESRPAKWTRHKNPDGTIGGQVSVDADVDPSATVEAGAMVLPGAFVRAGDIVRAGDMLVANGDRVRFDS